MSPLVVYQRGVSAMHLACMAWQSLSRYRAEIAVHSDTSKTYQQLQRGLCKDFVDVSTIVRLLFIPSSSHNEAQHIAIWSNTKNVEQSRGHFK